jgi:hypothetical protein
VPPDGDNSGDELVKALTNAAATIAAIYDWVDRVEKAGGTTCMEGVAAAHAMMTSLKKNRARVSRLVLEPARWALKNRPPRGQRPETRRSSDEVKR